MQGMYNIDEFRDSVFEAAGRGEVQDRLVVEGLSLGEVVQAYDDAIERAVGLGDFTQVLSLDRNFHL